MSPAPSEQGSLSVVACVVAGPCHPDTETAVLAVSPLLCTMKDPPDRVQMPAIHDLAPKYLSQLLNTRQWDRLRQSDAVLLHQLVANKCVGEQAFGVAAPWVWNAWPWEIHSAATLGAFKISLKTQSCLNHTLVESMHIWWYWEHAYLVVLRICISGGIESMHIWWYWEHAYLVVLRACTSGDIESMHIWWHCRQHWFLTISIFCDLIIFISIF